MCGILSIISGGLEVSVGATSHSGPEARSPAAEDFAEGLRCRGPDAQGSCKVSCGNAQLSFHGSLLQLRGAAPCRSPLADAAGNVLLFNGQVFGGRLDVPPRANDAALLLQALGQPGANVPTVLSGLQGPWALVFWHSATCTLWFGRDAIGRRSLLLHLPTPEDGRFMLSSAAPVDPAVPFRSFSELPPGLYSLSLEQAAGSLQARLPCALQQAANGLEQPLNGPEAGGSEPGRSGFSAAAEGSGSDVGSSGSRVRARYKQHEWADPPTARLAQFWRGPELVHPPAERHAAGESPAAGPDGAAEEVAAAGVEQPPEAAAGAPAGAGVSTAAAAAVGRPEAGGGDAAFEGTVDAILGALRRSVATRCRCIEEHGRGAQQEEEGSLEGQQLQQHWQQDFQQQERQQAQKPAARAHTGAPRSPSTPQPQPMLPPLLRAAPVLILFSGGVDSTLLAALAHEALPAGVPIDLASVCFDGGRSPDRLSALDALEELRQAAPGREWRLIRVDCTLQDVDASRPRLLRLLAPCDTVMDLNIGAALWLAARGEGALLAGGEGGGGGAADGGLRAEPAAGAAGAESALAAAPAAGAEGQSVEHARSTGSQQPAAAAQGRCRSAARVVLLGHGADELFGGYGRHRTAFRTKGWQGLADEVALDLRRLWLRNLGRDDRLVADHGREARHPFLDEGLVSASLAAPLHHLADLSFPPGTGDKRVLRACLRRLGLPRAAARAKRAIQFGSRLAKQTNEQAFGSVRRANLRNAGSVQLAAIGLAGVRLGEERREERGVMQPGSS